MKDKKKKKKKLQRQLEHLSALAKEKDAATKLNEPWVGILTLDVDYDNLDRGSFELDWNDYFITRLIKAGYEGKEDHDLVDQWFNQICRDIVLETYQQEEADPEKREKALPSGRKEYL